MNYTYYLFLIILLLSCQKSQEGKFETQYVEETTKEYSVTPQVLPIDILNPTGIVALDTFLVFVQRHEDKILKIYNTKGKELTKNILQKGKGPNDVILFTRFNQYYQKDGNSLVLIQSYPNSIGLLNINKSVQAGNAVFDYKENFNTGDKSQIFEESNAIFELNDSELLLTKDPVRSQTINENSNPFFVRWNYRTNEISDTIYINNLKDISWDNLLIYSAYPAIRPSKDKVAWFYTYMDAIIIIDINTKEKTKLGLSPMGLDTEFAIKMKSQVHHEAFATDSLIFGLRKEQGGKSVLYTYDWNGIFKYKIHLNENVLYFSINESDKTLYGIDDKDRILAYKLNFL